MFIRPRKHTAKDGSISISFQVLESSWDADRKRSVHKVVKNLGTCKIYRYDAARMTQHEYYRLILRKYTAFRESAETELKDFDERERLLKKIKKTIQENDNYRSGGFDDTALRQLYLIFNK